VALYLSVEQIIEINAEESQQVLADSIRCSEET